jgi:hypothetical protein
MDIRATPAEVLNLLDNLASCYQTEQAAIDGGFAGESTNTVLYGLRTLATAAGALGSKDAIAKVYPAVQSALANFDSQYRTSPGVTRHLAPITRATMAAICGHEATFDADYSDFWTWFKATAAASPADKILGECAELMIAAGIAVDATACVPPEHRIIAHLLYTGAAAATLTAWNAIDPQVFNGGQTVEIYCVARANTPNAIAGYLPASKTPTDTPLTDGSTAYAFTIADTLAAGQVVDLPEVDAGPLCAATSQLLDATVGHGTLTGGKSTDEFYLRVKRYRAASF